MVNTDDKIFKQELSFYTYIFENLNGRYIDIFDIHYYGMPGPPSNGADGWKGMKAAYDAVRKELDRNGYRSTEIWFTETGSESRQSERLQAADLVKRVVFPLSFGVKKVFWWNMIEGMYPMDEDQPPDHFGLVYDGIGKTDKGYGTKKLAYYSYKLMVEKLEGSDWDNIQTVKEEENDAYGIYLYKFIKDSKPVYVGWFDCFDEQECSRMKIDTTVDISVGRDVEQIRITEAVPSAESDLDDYPNFFKTEVKAVKDGAVTISLTEIPVFVE